MIRIKVNNHPVAPRKRSCDFFCFLILSPLGYFLFSVSFPFDKPFCCLMPPARGANEKGRFICTSFSSLVSSIKTRRRRGVDPGPDNKTRFVTLKYLLSIVHLHVLPLHAPETALLDQLRRRPSTPFRYSTASYLFVQSPLYLHRFCSPVTFPHLSALRANDLPSETGATGTIFFFR